MDWNNISKAAKMAKAPLLQFRPVFPRVDFRVYNLRRVSMHKHRDKWKRAGCPQLLQEEGNRLSLPIVVALILNSMGFMLASR